VQQELNQPRSRFFYGYWILLVGFICQVIMNGFVMYSFSLYVLPLDNEFGWSRAAIMTGNLVLALIMGFTSPLVGRIIYRWGAKSVIAAGALAMGVGFALLSLTQSLWQFYLFYAVIGLGATATGVVPLSIVAANWFKRRRGFAIGILGMGIGAGGFVAPRLLSSYVIPSLGWRAAYLASGIISAVIIIPLSLWLIKWRPEDMGLLPDNGDVGEDEHRGASGVTEPGLKLNQAMKTLAFWLMAVSFTAFGFSNSHTFQNQVPHLEDIGFLSIEASVALQAVGIGSAIGKFGFGWLCDYIRPKYVLIIGAVLQAGATLILMSVNNTAPILLIWIYGLVMGLGIGSWLPAISMNTSDTFGLVDYGTIFGVYNMLFMLIGAVSPVIGGYIFDTTGSYHLGFVLCLIFYAVTVLSVLPMRRPEMSKE